ncbi:MAG: Macoilin family protein [Bacteriophage sp.]|nr:MAG: Macoilin family protein [Bacteriophage sp.]
MANIQPYIDQILNAVYGEEVRSSIVNALEKVNDDNNSYADLKKEVIAAKDAVDKDVDAVQQKLNAASTALTNLQNATSAANTAKTNLQDATNTANTAKENLTSATSTANTAKSNVEAATNAAKTAISNANTAKANLEKVITSATTTQSNLQGVIDNANQIKAQLDSSNATAVTSKKNLDSAISDASVAKSQLQEVINSASSVKTSLSNVISTANTAKSNLDASVATANNVLQSLSAENASAASNIDELKSENFNSQEILSGVADIRAYLGITADDIVGIQVDYKNKTFKRLAGAANLTKGSDFDKFTMFGGRKRCNVADDGSIVAWYGDADYKEDGSMGQVMVYQPKFYYLVCPVEYDPIDTGIGYHLRKANYYVSEKPRAGFRLHPAFYDASGNEIDYFLTSAYEGSIYDASASAYLLNDEQVMNTGEDKFSSIAGARPASGSSQNLTRPNIEAMAQNRGTNWHGDLIKQVSAEQMLMIIEMGMMNLQTAIAQGIVSLPWTTGSDTTSSYAAATGSTASLGNGTGRAEKTTTYEGGVAKEYTVDGKTSVCWRGKENFWGNIWKFVYGINIWGNGKMGGGQPYICSDFSFAESKNSGNYEPAGFTVTNANGYISAMGYSTACDWLFIASECLGNSSLPVGDYTYITINLNGYRIALLGGGWSNGGSAGGFYWPLYNGVGARYRNLGGRLVYIPTRDSATYTAAIEAWKQKMAA